MYVSVLQVTIVTLSKHYEEDARKDAAAESVSKIILVLSIDNRV
jgi:hypothetical protein